MDRVSRFWVSLTPRTTTCPPALRQRPVPPVMGKDVGRLIEGEALDGQLTAAKACGDHALEGERGCSTRTKVHTPPLTPTLVAIAEQVLAAHVGVTERGLSPVGARSTTARTSVRYLRSVIFTSLNRP
jgi:hypothetical protein